MGVLINRARQRLLLQSLCNWVGEKFSTTEDQDIIRGCVLAMDPINAEVGRDDVLDKGRPSSIGFRPLKTWATWLSIGVARIALLGAGNLGEETLGHPNEHGNGDYPNAV